MKKIILIGLIIFSFAISVFADLPNPPSTEINDGQPLIARPVYNSLKSLYNVLFGNVDSLNIKAGGINADRLAGGITPTYLQSPFDINRIIADGNITFAKLNSNIFGEAASVIYNNGYIDLRYNTTLFEKDGSNNLNIKNNSITGTQINTNLAGAGLSFDISTPKKLQVNVDSTTIAINGDTLELQANVSLDGGTTYLKPNIAISANASDSLQTTDKTSLVSAINELNDTIISLSSILNDTKYIYYNDFRYTEVMSHENDIIVFNYLYLDGSYDTLVLKAYMKISVSSPSAYIGVLINGDTYETSTPSTSLTWVKLEIPIKSLIGEYPFQIYLHDNYINNRTITVRGISMYLTK